MIIEERSDQLVIMDKKGIVDTKPKTEYFILKHKDFNGNRIFFKFNDNCLIHETYNDGIFNCTYNKESMQIRQADKIAFCINWFRYNKDPKTNLKPFEELFKSNFIETIQTDVLKNLLKNYDNRLDFLSDGIEIDKRFFVNKNGVAHSKKNNVYHFLCIVASGYLSNFDINSSIGNIEINCKTLEIIAKVLFLLNPNIKDKVFYEQLDPKLQEELKRDQLK